MRRPLRTQGIHSYAGIISGIGWRIKLRTSAFTLRADAFAGFKWWISERKTLVEMHLFGKKQKTFSASCYQPHNDVVIKTGSGMRHQLAIWLKITAVIMKTFTLPNTMV